MEGGEKRRSGSGGASEGPLGSDSSRIGGCFGVESLQQTEDGTGDVAKGDVNVVSKSADRDLSTQ